MPDVIACVRQAGETALDVAMQKNASKCLGLLSPVSADCYANSIKRAICRYVQGGPVMFLHFAQNGNLAEMKKVGCSTHWC